MKTPLRFLRAMWHALLYKLAGRPVIAPVLVRHSRMSTCHACPHHRLGFCRLCDCLLLIKTKLASEGCPDIPPRWEAL